jgi:glycosyltransferase involved in cell wall biosynthesis
VRVVHVITGLATGGAERMLQDRVARTRHQVEVVVLSVEGEIADRLRADGVPVHSLGMTSNQDLTSVFALARLLRRLSPDVVHVHLYRALIYGRIAARMAGIRAVLATEHSALEDSTEGRPATRGVRILYRMAERLGRVTVAVSSTTRDIMIRYWGIPAPRIVVVPNGIDTARLRITPERRATARAAHGLVDGVRVVVGAGRLVEGKRFDVLIDAVAQLDPSVHLMIAGDGPEREALVSRAIDAGVAERTHFIGVVEDIVDALAAGDVFASASMGETYGIAIVEAYTAGLPVAYAQCPAVADVTGGVAHSRLVEADGSVGGMATAIATALTQGWGPDLVDDRERGRVDIESVNRRLDDLEDLVGSDRWSLSAVSTLLGDGTASAR